MEELRHILVVSRRTKQCREAVHMGVSLSKKFGADLTVLHVVDQNIEEGMGLTFVIEEELKHIMKKAEQELDEIIRSEKINGTPINEIVRTGNPNEEILKVVDDESIDLIIMLSHPEGRIERFLFGRDNDKIVRKMPCSILLLKAEHLPIK
ncbi:universal stress protein [Nitrospirota bacterium]